MPHRGRTEPEPAWELPQLEIGIILLNANRCEEARPRVEKVYADTMSPSPHLKYSLGTALCAMRRLR